MMLIVGLIICQKFAPPGRRCHFLGSPADVRKGSGIQGSKGIVLRQSIKDHKPERGRGAKLFLFRPVFNLIPTLWYRLHLSSSLHPLDMSTYSCSNSLTYPFYTVPNHWDLDGFRAAHCSAQLPPQSMGRTMSCRGRVIRPRYVLGASLTLISLTP